MFMFEIFKKINRLEKLLIRKHYIFSRFASGIIIPKISYFEEFDLDRIARDWKINHKCDIEFNEVNNFLYEHRLGTIKKYLTKSMNSIFIFGTAFPLKPTSNISKNNLNFIFPKFRYLIYSCPNDYLILKSLLVTNPDVKQIKLNIL